LRSDFFALVVENERFHPKSWLKLASAASADTAKEAQARFRLGVGKREGQGERTCKIVQGSPTWVWPDIAKTELRAGRRSFGSALMGSQVEF
jgi:hypothetical protein